MVLDPGGRPPGSHLRRATPSLVVVCAALVCSMPDHHLAPPQRGRPPGSPPLRRPPPLVCLFPTLLFPPPELDASRLTARVTPTLHGLRKPLRRRVGVTLAVNLEWRLKFTPMGVAPTMDALVGPMPPRCAHLLLQELEHLRFRDDLSAPSYVEFSTDVQDVFLDRIHTEDEVTGNLPVGSTIQ